MKVSLCHLHSIFPHTYLYIRQGSFTKNVSWGIVIISSCLLLIGSCLWLLSGNGKRDWLKAVNWSSYYCHMKTRTCRKRNRHRDTDRDTQPCLFQRNVNEPTSTSCDQDPPPIPIPSMTTWYWKRCGRAFIRHRRLPGHFCVASFTDLLHGHEAFSLFPLKGLQDLLLCV